MEIQGYENYLIYPDGRVSSSRFKGRFLKTDIRTGYYYVNLYKDKKAKKHTIHRLVAQHYIPNPENKPQVDHINRDRLDNRIENLRWVTAKENSDNTGMLNTNTSCHKNICYDNYYHKWIFYRIINGKSYRKSFKTKTEALCFKFIFLLMFKAEIVPPILPLK